jgi:GNAT superfamily N-acetyltransferase
MKIGPRKYGGATCEIRFAEGVPDRIRHDVRLLTNLQTEWASRGQGHATELVNRCFTEADRWKVILLVNPEAYPVGGEAGPNTDELVEWYGRMGFNEIQHAPLLMARMFNIPQIVDTAEKVSKIILEGVK